MFVIKQDEKEAVIHADKLKEDIEVLDRSIQSKRYGQETRKEVEQLLEQRKALEAQFQALIETEVYQRYSLKTGINQALSQKLIVPIPVWLELAEEVVDELNGSDGERAIAILKKAVLRVYSILSDADLQAAGAEMTAARYKALVNAGLPAELVGQIVVAEAHSMISILSSLKR